jgi:hypothetical protein
MPLDSRHLAGSSLIGNPEGAIEECDANCDAVSLRVFIASVVTFANVDLVAFSIACMTDTNNATPLLFNS